MSVVPAKHKINLFSPKYDKYFNNDNLRNDLLHEINKLAFNVITCEEILFMVSLNKHAHLKITYYSK